MRGTLLLLILNLMKAAKSLNALLRQSYLKNPNILTAQSLKMTKSGFKAGNKSEVLNMTQYIMRL